MGSHIGETAASGRALRHPGEPERPSTTGMSAWGEGWAGAARVAARFPGPPTASIQNALACRGDARVSAQYAGMSSRDGIVLSALPAEPDVGAATGGGMGGARRPCEWDAGGLVVQHAWSDGGELLGACCGQRSP